MASIKIILNIKKTDKMGEAPIFIRITKNRISKYIAVGVKINPQHWNADKGRVKKSHKNWLAINELIVAKVAVAEKIGIEHEVKDIPLPNKRLKQMLKPDEGLNFFEYTFSYTERLFKAGKIGTYSRANAVVSKLKVYLGNLKKRPLLQ